MSPRNWLSSIIWGEPNLGPLEQAYRAHTHRADIGQVVALGWTYCVAVVLYAIIEFQVFGFTSFLISIYAARAVMLLFSVGILLALRQTTSPQTAEWLALVWSVSVAGFALFIHLTRLDALFANILVDLIFIIVFYTATPNRYLFRVIPAVLLSLGDIILIRVSGLQVSLIDLRSVTAALILGNLTGIIISVHLYTYRRQQFKAQHEEQLARREIERLATLDGLTQVLNRRRFMELAETEFQRFRRYQHPFSLLLIDLDHFKQINDSYGHSAGDAVLREFCSLTQSLIRQNDLLGRLGGEEFAILLPETQADYALQFASRMREHCEQLSVQNRGRVIRVTASIGVTQVQAQDAALEDTFHRADQGLYYVKANGRNKAHLILSG